MKERSCQDLKEFAEQYYWNHVARFHFITVMLPGFNHQMVFPEKFVKNSKDDLSENVILKGPSGNLWLVKLLKVQGDLLFKEGWKEFVEAHNVEEDLYTSRRKRARPRQIVQENTEQRSLYEVHLVSNRRPVTDEEKDRAFWHASELKPDNPFFRIVMRDTHVYKHHFMTIPVDFVAEHLPSDYQAADLRIANGKTTYHDVRLERQNASVGLSGQLWRNFVQANNLEEGDACVFELCSTDRILLFDVHIFRVVEEVAPLDKQSVRVREVAF
ncbi:B3 domain-containing protein-like [Iris pallida]|uniref:B3 domain-containing protein-like n=1 Tax=Iris pallida TaxID=29817 RepID=A0AAX6EVX5_IRIPA|nr:B3 domain-containing protein-like [Iris pallida]